VRIPVSFLLLGFLFAEIAGFILVGQAIGVLPTLALVLLSMVAGVLLLRWQGVATLIRVRRELAENRAPTRPLAEGALLAVASLFLIVPGFLTDILGLLLFIPFVRARIHAAFRVRGSLRATGFGAARYEGGPVVDIGSQDYGAAEDSGGQKLDSPWRIERGGGA
jgi:UPF0716 protein FxsA